MVIEKSNSAEPFVKWAGGKRQLLPEIMKYIPDKINNYYEPFIGGGAVFFNIKCNHPIINDFNRELINSYMVVKNDVENLINLLKIHENNNSKEYYYKLRSWDRTNSIENKSNTERAARFIYLNKTGFNGLFRVNSQEQFNVPYGRYKHPSIVNVENLRKASLYLNNSEATILNGDYYNAIKKAKKGDFVYLDPPYAPLTQDRESFVGYTINGFGKDQQIRLRNVFDELTNKGVYAMLSNSKVPLIENLYEKYKNTTKIVSAKRNINSNTSGRGEVQELLIKNY
ncbi:DNA adenine methylase [Fructilactobacillus carniphilus]|uniref:Site-specific DNA-methyltransferase (adenine-specific) n=1 Tax=Fructilactobacillus carniphilus TaxID=2940297 RepID=A0ABY5BVZ8_9LACO|nr:DNA adenine methylase [Fructilactobacillus carniphilus]USS90681.1 DNA adenine methylase [Fructilactobacillus carniphilus]